MKELETAINFTPVIMLSWELLWTEKVAEPE
jgi:hypothetical protein